MDAGDAVLDAGAGLSKMLVGSDVSVEDVVLDASVGLSDVFVEIGVSVVDVEVVKNDTDFTQPGISRTTGAALESSESRTATPIVVPASERSLRTVFSRPQARTSNSQILSAVTAP